MENTNDEYLSLLESLYLLVLYLSGGDTYDKNIIDLNSENSDLIEPYSKETFINIQSWISLQYSILDQLEEKELLKQPQKGTRNKRRTYIEMNKRGMLKARMLLQQLNLEGAKEALTERSYHEEYINHQNAIERRKRT